MGQCLALVEMADKQFIKNIQTDIQKIPPKILETPQHDYEPDPRGLGWELYNAMLKNQHKIAQICTTTEKEETYKSLIEKTISTAIRLKERGLKQGDLILVYSYNHINSLVPWLSSLFLGCVIAYIDPIISQNDTIHLIKQIKPGLKIAFAVKESEKLMQEALEKAGINNVDLIVFEKSDYNNKVFEEEFLGNKNNIDNDFRPYSGGSHKDTAVIFFSSGTTGLPKGICANHYALACQANNLVKAGYSTKLIMSYASMYWISTAVSVVSIILNGGTRLLCYNFNPSTAWKFIDKFRPTLMFLAPIQAIFMLKVGRPDGIVTTSLREVLIGGGHLMPNYLVAFRDLLPGAEVYLCYGQTEVTGTLAFYSPNLRKDVLLANQKPESCGRLAPGIQCKVVNSETEELLGPHQKGELRVKTKYAMNGYYLKDSSSSWDSEGWLRTGDLVYYDEDECFYVVDRLKELLKYQAFHVTPSAIEQVLNKHPSVKLAVVIGIPHEVDGDHPMAVIVLNENSNGINSEDILEFANSRLDNIHKLRGGVKIVKAIPMTATGKPKRQELKNLVLSGRI